MSGFPPSGGVLSCGVNVDPPQILVVYKKGARRRLRKIVVDAVRSKLQLTKFVDELYRDERHCALLTKIPKAQIIRLVYILHDLVNGISLDQTLKYNDEIERISPNEDLNKESDEVVERYFKE